MALLTPELLRSMQRAQPGVVIQMPDPTWRDAYAQWIKNLTQIVSFVAIIAAAGSVAGEVTSGTALLVLTKPLSRSRSSPPRPSPCSRCWPGVLTGTLVTQAVTFAVFGTAPAGALWLPTLAWLVFAALLVSIGVLLSSISPRLQRPVSGSEPSSRCRLRRCGDRSRDTPRPAWLAPPVVCLRATIGAADVADPHDRVRVCGGRGSCRRAVRPPGALAPAAHVAEQLDERLAELASPPRARWRSRTPVERDRPPVHARRARSGRRAATETRRPDASEKPARARVEGAMQIAATTEPGRRSRARGAARRVVEEDRGTAPPTKTAASQARSAASATEIWASAAKPSFPIHFPGAPLAVATCAPAFRAPPSASRTPRRGRRRANDHDDIRHEPAPVGWSNTTDGGIYTRALLRGRYPQASDDRERKVACPRG